MKIVTKALLTFTLLTLSLTSRGQAEYKLWFSTSGVNVYYRWTGNDVYTRRLLLKIENTNSFEIKWEYDGLEWKVDGQIVGSEIGAGWWIKADEKTSGDTGGQSYYPPKGYEMTSGLAMNFKNFRITNSTVKSTDNDNNNHNSNIQSNNSSYQKNGLQEQQRQEAEQSRQQSEQQRILQENQRGKQEQLERINEANKRTAEYNQQVFDGIANIGDILIQNSFRNSIQEENAKRQARFSELRELAKTKTGNLTSCTHCNGVGYNTCSSCSGGGKNACVYCAGQGKTSHSFCGGTGQVFGNTCSVCGGAGSIGCVTCKGSGNMYCVSCHATGKDFCIYCSGTGQEFNESREISNTAASQPIVNSQSSVYQITPSNQSSGDFTAMNKKAPNFEISASDGNVYQLNSFSGKKVILIFWSSLNEKSIQEFKRLSDNAELINRGYVLIDIALEYSKFQWKKTLIDFELKGIHLCEFQGKDSDASQAYQVRETPKIFLIESNIIIGSFTNAASLKF